MYGWYIDKLVHAPNRAVFVNKHLRNKYDSPCNMMVFEMSPVLDGHMVTCRWYYR